MKTYRLTDAHATQLPAWRDKWIANALSTEGMTEQDRETCRGAVERLYQAAHLPPPRHIVFAPSPFVLWFAGGFAAWEWWCSRQATRQATALATEQATRLATAQATRLATAHATAQATAHATEQATRLAVAHATTHATAQATAHATELATEQATWQATRLATELATELATTPNIYSPQFSWVAQCPPVYQYCAQKISHLVQWGNQASAFDSFLSFFREVCQLPLDYTAWEPWETLSLHSGPRIVHADFCMISDRPKLLKIDEQSRPHCDTGPFCQWRDGSAIYAVHGHFIPWWVIEHPERITIDCIQKEENAETQRVMIQRFGWERYLEMTGSTLVDADTEPHGAAGLRGLFQARDGKKVLVCCCASSGETYHLEVPPDIETCQQAAMWLAGGETQWLLART